MRSTLALWIGLLAASGCYSYRPATLEAVPVGTDIRGLLGTEARITLEDRYGRRFDQLNGTLVERNGDSVLVETRSVSAADGRALHQRLAVAQSDMLRVDVKRFDKVRTIAFVGGVVTLATILFVKGFYSHASGEDGGGGGPNEAPPAGDPGGPYR
jgi:hypothetical protein